LEISSGGVGRRCRARVRGLYAAICSVSLLRRRRHPRWQSTIVHPRVGVFVVGQVGEEDVGAADGRGEVRVGAAADGREGGEVAAIGFEEDSDERGRVERAEAAAEGRGRADGGEEGTAGERRADDIITPRSSPRV
jgi:hypothetical protein